MDCCHHVELKLQALQGKREHPNVSVADERRFAAKRADLWLHGVDCSPTCTAQHAAVSCGNNQALESKKLRTHCVVYIRMPATSALVAVPAIRRAIKHAIRHAMMVQHGAGAIFRFAAIGICLYETCNVSCRCELIS